MTGTVKDYLNQYHNQEISLEELSCVFNTQIEWDYRTDLFRNEVEGDNLWSHVFQALEQGKLDRDEYIFLTQEYEDMKQEEWLLEFQIK